VPFALTNVNMFSSQAKSKLILAGEHGVVYGTSAITTRLLWTTHCQLSPDSCQTLILSNGQKLNWHSAQLTEHWQDLQLRHQAWQLNSITPVLTSLSDLPLAVLARWQSDFPLPALSIRITSDIPIGQGLGSSASLILALLQGLASATQQRLTPVELIDIAIELEQLAHGKSSGLDVYALAFANRLLWKQGQATVIDKPVPLSGYLVNTGLAETSTADCVGWVKQHHANNQLIWQSMESATQALVQRLSLAHRMTELSEYVSQLQDLLTQIGVVPAKVASFTQAAQSLGWSGKICGSGSIRGEGAGFFWLLSDREPKQLCHEYGYPYWSLAQLTEGCL